MSHPGYDTRPPTGAAPDGAYGHWAAPGTPEPTEPPRKRSFKAFALKAVGLFGGAVVALVAVSMFNTLDDPAVGDCVKTTSDSAFEVVDCTAGDAQFRVVGVEEEQQTEVEFQADTDVCSAFDGWDIALWNPGTKTMYGTVYCAEQL